MKGKHAVGVVFACKGLDESINEREEVRDLKAGGLVDRFKV